jgi:hypothetical protein
MSVFAKPVSWLLGLVLLVAGVAGFFTGGTLLIFQVDPVHNVVHIISGLTALLMSRRHAQECLVLLGVFYGVIAVLGFFNSGDILGLFTTNLADDYFHLAIAAVGLVVGFGGKR